MDFPRLFARKQTTAMFALRTETGKVRYAFGRPDAAPKPVIESFGEALWQGDGASLVRAFKSFGVGKRARCAALLSSTDYQISVVEAPNVPAAEMKSAMRWRMKEIIDYPVEQAVYDLLEIPPAGAGGAQGRLVYVIAARSEVVRACVARFAGAKVPLEIIDIPETAQRNIAALYEQEGRGVGLLYFDDAGGLLTVTCGGELYLARRFDFTMNQIRQEGEAYRDDLYDRILVELQRTLDNFERQNSQIVLSRLLLGPQPEQTSLSDYLRANLGMEVADCALQDVIAFHDVVPDARAQWEFFHLIGCALRLENA